MLTFTKVAAVSHLCTVNQWVNEHRLNSSSNVKLETERQEMI